MLTSCDFSSLVIDKLGDEAKGRNTAVTCFYFDYAVREEQSLANMLGSLLRQLAGKFEHIPDVIVEEFRNQKEVVEGRRLKISRILEMFLTIATTMHTFICVDALDECAPEHRVEVLNSLGKILRRSRNTRVFMTGRPHIRCEIEGRLGGAVVFVSVGPTEDDVVGYLRERLRKDIMPGIMNSRSKEDIMKTIHETSSET